MLNVAVLSLLSITSPVEAVSGATPLPPSRLYANLSACKVRLADTPVVSRRITGEDAVLCAWRRGTDETYLIRVSGGLATGGFTVELQTRNGVNSQYKVIRPEGLVVLGIKTNVSAGTMRLRETRTVRNKHGKKVRRSVDVLRARARPVIYVPFHDDLRDPALVEIGKIYLRRKVEEARAVIDARQVWSKVPRGDGRFDWLITETIPERSLLILLIIEHIDPSWVATPREWRELPLDVFRRLKLEQIERAIERVLVTYALNGEDAYDYAGSFAGAYGFAQFIKPTYDRVRREYPAAELLSDFGEGMRDHLNAVIAQYCLADLTLTALSPESRARLMDGTREEDLGAWLAAAYNGGEHYAAPAYDHSSQKWAEPGPPIHPPKRLKGKRRKAWVRKKLLSEHRIPADTVIYVRGFRQYYRHLFVHDASHTPSP